MKTNKLTISAILLALGTILHFAIPAVFFGIKPYYLLVMAFYAIYLSADFKLTLAISLAAGIISAMATSFPMGQIPNIIDKIISGIFVYFIFEQLRYRLNSVGMACIIAFGTLLSGVAFLSTALAMINQIDLFYASLPIVFATLVINGLLSTVIFKTFSRTRRYLI